MKKFYLLLFYFPVLLFGATRCEIKFVKEIELVDESKDIEVYPNSAVLDSKGKLWVVDSFVNRSVFIFKPKEDNWQFEKQLTKNGQGPGEIEFPTCIAVDSNNNIYVGERPTKRIHVFTNQGKFLYSFIVTTELTSISVFNDFLYVIGNSQPGRETIYKYTLKGKLVDKFLKAPKLRNRLEDAWAVPLIDFVNSYEMFAAFRSPDLGIAKYVNKQKVFSFGDKDKGTFPAPKMVIEKGARRVLTLVAYQDLKVFDNKWLFVLERGGSKSLRDKKGWLNNSIAVYSLKGDFIKRVELVQEISNGSHLLKLKGNRFYYFNSSEPALYEYKYNMAN